MNILKIRRTVIACLLLTVSLECVRAQVELKGIVRDAASNGALVSVNIVLQTQDSAFTAGTASDGNGRFVIPNIKPGDYRLALSYIGYITQYIELEGLKANLAIPDIVMEEDAVGLGEITVTASATTSRIDRKLIFPTERQVQASSNGFDLLQQLMLPSLQINPLTREILAHSEGEVQLRINGAKVELDDVIALLPKDVIRVEYHDNPGLRYGNAVAVIDCIVRRHETGGNIGLNLMNSVALKRFGTNAINGRINHRKSEFSFNYSMRHSDMEQYRESEETFHLADGWTIRRKEVGDPEQSFVRGMGHNLNTAYSYLNEKRMFNATFRHSVHDQPNWDMYSSLFNVDNPDDFVLVTDRTKTYSSGSSLDLYYQENLKNDQALLVNIVGSYGGTDETRIYRESRDAVMLTDINNNIDGYMRSLTGEGVYEKKLGGNVLSAGIRYSQSFVDNTYKNGYEYHTDMLQSTTFFYGEWKGKVQKLDYTLGAGVTRSCFRQEGSKDYDTWTFNPRIAMFYRLSGASSLRLTAGVNNWPPQLYTLSAVDQQVDSLQFVRGNPNLKPNLQYRTDLSWEWRKGIFYANMQGKYEYHPSGIMSEKFLENDKVFETWNNQKNWHGMSAILNLRVVPLKDILTVTVKGGVNRYISHGNSFRHVYTNPFCDAVLSGMYGNFNASLLWHTPVNRLYGENLNGGDNYHVLSLGYRYREMNFGLGAYSPFANDYRIDTENRSSVASYKRSYYSNQMSGLVYFQFAYNFSFGRKYHSGEKRLYNSNEGETSIMSTGK